MKPEWHSSGGIRFRSATRRQRLQVLESRNDGKQIYVKCVPMHWPQENVRGMHVRVMARARCRRSAPVPVVERPAGQHAISAPQEMPAVYTMAVVQAHDLHRRRAISGGS